MKFVCSIMEKDYLFLNKGGIICLNLGLNRLATITWGLTLDKIKPFTNVTKLKLNFLPQNFPINNL